MQSARASCELCAKSLIAETLRTAEEFAEKLLLAAAAWVYPKDGAVGNLVIIELRGDKKVSRFASVLLDRGLGQRRHDFETRGIRMQAVIGEIFFQQALIVDHSG